MVATFLDNVAICDKRVTKDGYLAVSALVARTGIQEYLGSEIDPDNKLGLRDKATVKVFRPEDEVFSIDSIASYANKPVTNDHPSVPVNAGNWRDFATGIVGSNIVRNGEAVRVDLLLTDAAMIADVSNGKRELSAGYSANIVPEQGEFNGEVYDAVQRDIRINHVAVVDMGRAGPKYRIEDKFAVCDAIPSDGFETKRKYMEHYTIDGHQIPLDDTKAVSAALDKITADRDGVKAKLGDAETELAKRDAEIADLKAKVMDASAIDKLVADRSDLIAKAKLIDETFATDGKTNAEIMRGVVVAKVGDEMTAKSDDYIAARFDTLLDGVKDKDDIKDAIKDTKPANHSDARNAYLERLQKGE